MATSHHLPDDTKYYGTNLHKREISTILPRFAHLYIVKKRVESAIDSSPLRGSVTEGRCYWVDTVLGERYYCQRGCITEWSLSYRLDIDPIIASQM